VLFALPGRGSPPGSILESLRLHDLVAQSVERAGAAPMAVCAVGGGGYSYWHARADGTDTLRMLTEELVPRVREELGVERRRNAILGVSMGGYGALNAAARRPDLFAAAVGSSPALWRSRAEQASAVPEAFMTTAEFRANDLIQDSRALDQVPVRIDCGDADPFAPAVRALRASLPRRAAGGIAEGCHDGSFWRRVAPAQASFVVQHLSHAGET
jgi:S-formylglutathione hydrolase FrmB